MRFQSNSHLYPSHSSSPCCVHLKTALPSLPPPHGTAASSPGFFFGNLNRNVPEWRLTPKLVGWQTPFSLHDDDPSCHCLASFPHWKEILPHMPMPQSFSISESSSS